MNKRDTDLLDMLPALEDGSLMYTPISICRDMVNLIPDDVFNKDAKFLDIACKSGRFLREIMYRLMGNFWIFFYSNYVIYTGI